MLAVSGSKNMIINDSSYSIVYLVFNFFRHQDYNKT